MHRTDGGQSAMVISIAARADGLAKARGSKNFWRRRGRCTARGEVLGEKELNLATSTFESSSRGHFYPVGVIFLHRFSVVSSFIAQGKIQLRKLRPQPPVGPPAPTPAGTRWLNSPEPCPQYHSQTDLPLAGCGYCHYELGVCGSPGNQDTTPPKEKAKGKEPPVSPTNQRQGSQLAVGLLPHSRAPRPVNHAFAHRRPANHDHDQGP